MNYLLLIVHNIITIHDSTHTYIRKLRGQNMSINYLVFMAPKFGIICLIKSHLMYHMLVIKKLSKKYIQENDIPYRIT